MIVLKSMHNCESETMHVGGYTKRNAPQYLFFFIVSDSIIIIIFILTSSMLRLSDRYMITSAKGLLNLRKTPN